LFGGTGFDDFCGRAFLPVRNPIESERVMTPMQIFEGSRIKPEDPERAERRLADLAQAVRQHEDTARSHPIRQVHAHDRSLYRRLRQICGD
jgi:hypothetical protein